MRGKKQKAASVKRESLSQNLWKATDKGFDAESCTSELRRSGNMFSLLSLPKGSVRMSYKD